MAFHDNIRGIINANAEKEKSRESNESKAQEIAMEQWITKMCEVIKADIEKNVRDGNYRSFREKRKKMISVRGSIIAPPLEIEYVGEKYSWPLIEISETVKQGNGWFGGIYDKKHEYNFFVTQLGGQLYSIVKNKVAGEGIKLLMAYSAKQGYTSDAEIIKEYVVPNVKKTIRGDWNKAYQIRLVFDYIYECEMD